MPDDSHAKPFVRGFPSSAPNKWQAASRKCPARGFSADTESLRGCSCAFRALIRCKERAFGVVDRRLRDGSFRAPYRARAGSMVPEIAAKMRNTDLCSALVGYVRDRRDRRWTPPILVLQVAFSSAVRCAPSSELRKNRAIAPFLLMFASLASIQQKRFIL